jgi:hypothetical protein
VIMCDRDGGVEVLAQERTFTIGAALLRDLLFFNNRVFLTENGEPAKMAYVVPDRKWINFWIDGIHHVIQRSRFVWVARGDIPVDRLHCVGDR